MTTWRDLSKIDRVLWDAMVNILIEEKEIERLQELTSIRRTDDSRSIQEILACMEDLRLVMERYYKSVSQRMNDT